MSLSILAIVTARNEEIHVRRCISDFVNDGIQVVLIDNDSTDHTLDIVREFEASGLIAVERQPWRGVFSLSDQLQKKREIIASSRHDWIIHADADERLISPIPGQSLRGGIEAAHAAGYTCVNFLELVFLPLQGEDFEVPDYAEKMVSYYFFQPAYPRLMRAWARVAGLTSEASGGHVLQGESINIFPKDFLLLHYMALSEAHVRRKYVGRRFSDEGVEKNWHRNRKVITDENIQLRERREEIKTLPMVGSKNFDLTSPTDKHYWQWSR